MASISEMLEDAKASVKQMEKKHNFKKANKDREAAVQLQYDLGLCRAKLERCKKQFDQTIREQSRHIEKGRSEGLDVLVQEQILWDAALGYLLVRDAIFALQSVNNYDTVEHAYELLNAAVRQMTGKREKKRNWGFMRDKERDSYGYLTSAATLKEKETKLDGFFEELKKTGDIEACLAAARNPNDVRGDREQMASTTATTSTSGESDFDQTMARLRQNVKLDRGEEDLNITIDTDVRPPEY